ncbi:MAG: copper resistance protein CopC/CopD, partial [Acidimicrobiia bacterium]|nr:copper resistance protein CopC/CopD [Acidimicrobiia bacterium]
MSHVHRIAGLLLTTIVLVLVNAVPASAHTGFDSSIPADGETVADPLPQITLVFTGEAAPTGDGFQILDAAGELRSPTTATSADGLTWLLTFEPPLAGGTFGMRWVVKAPDAHAIDGAFSFTVTAPDPAAPALTEAPVSPGQAATAGDETVNLDSFLAGDGDSTASADRVAAVARIISLVGAMVGVGALVFAAAVLRGAPSDIRFVLYWVRRSGVLLLIGALIELFAQVVVAGGGPVSALWNFSALGSVVFSSLGIAIGLRAVGGVALATGSRLTTICATQVADPVVAVRELVGVGAGSSASAGWPSNFVAEGAAPNQNTEPYIHAGDRAWTAGTDSAVGFAGALAVLASFLFDGHTVSKGHRLFTSLVDVVHVAGAAVWVGGVIMLASVLWRRHRRDHELRALQLAVRFSVVASGALAVVGVAGLILAYIVLDSPAELW